MATRKGPSAPRQQPGATEMGKQQAQALRRRRSVRQWTITLSALVLVGVIGAVAVVTSREAAKVTQPSADAVITLGGQANVPLDVSADRVRVGAADAPVTLSVYEDFSCPHCQTYEASIGKTLDELVAGGDVAVEYHPMQVATNYGNRAGSAATCVAVGAPALWPEVHASLFALHDSTTDSWSNDQLRDYLSDEGISDDDVLECVTSGRYETWIDQNTQTAIDDGVSETPTLRINGESSVTLDSAELRAAVDAALEGQ